MTSIISGFLNIFYRTVQDSGINKIRTSEFLYADLTGARPNVYYEVGFAHALSKKVILYRRSGESLHFDLAGYNCPEYKNLADLEKNLLIDWKA